MRRSLVILGVFPAVLAAQPANRPSTRENNGFSVERLQRVDAYQQDRGGSRAGAARREGRVRTRRGVVR